MAKKRKARRDISVEVPQIGEPLENPNFVTPPALNDPLGSWTGVPMPPTETPVQDADDL